MVDKDIFESRREAKERSRQIKKSLNQSHFDVHDLRYMSSLSAAVLAKSPSASKRILWLIVGVVIWFLVWASQAQVDELTRGEGKIIPSNQVQILQNLEGGIVSEILVHEGDAVLAGDILLKIDNKGFTSSFEESQLRLNELNAKFLRLNAEANEQDFDVDTFKSNQMLSQVRFEKSLYDSNKEQLGESLKIINEQIRQRQNELNELEAKIEQLKSSYALMQKEVEITTPLFKKGLVSEVEFLQLKRQANSMKGDLEAARLSIPRVQSTIIEAQNKITETKLGFRNNAKKELNEVAAEIARIQETQTTLEDRVSRTLVRAPVNGTISRLLVNTISGVVKPGMDLIEIIPSEDKLIAEVKVKPADIAFLRPGLKAMVKFTAYDFAIHGGLEGKLTQISPDTITDDKGDSFYMVRIETEKNHLGSEINPLKIIVGMTVSVDIMTGKKSVLDYLLKPILKAKNSALRER